MVCPVREADRSGRDHADVGENLLVELSLGRVAIDVADRDLVAADDLQATVAGDRLAEYGLDRAQPILAALSEGSEHHFFAVAALGGDADLDLLLLGIEDDQVLVGNLDVESLPGLRAGFALSFRRARSCRPFPGPRWPWPSGRA